MMRNSIAIAASTIIMSSASFQKYHLSTTRTNLFARIENSKSNEHLEKDHKSCYDLSLDKMETYLKISDKKRMGDTLLSNPSLLEACYKSSGDKFTQLVDYVGKDRLEKMILSHSDLFVNVLNDSKLKSKMDVIQKNLNLSSSQTKLIERKISPEIMKRIHRSSLNQKLFFLKAQFNLDNNQMLEVILSWPNILSYSIEKYLRAIDFFYHEAGLNSNELKKMVCNTPIMLAYSVHSNLRPKLDFLKHDIGCNSDQIKKIFSRYPRVISHSLENVLRPKLNFIPWLFRLETSVDMPKIVSAFPPLLYLSESNLIPKVKYLQEELNLNDGEIQRLFTTMPQLLGLNIENNLQPKVSFLKDVLGVDTLKEFVLYQPALLAYSLENRLRPRIEKMEENNIYFAYCQPYIMSITEDKFDIWLEQHRASWTTE